MKNIMSIDIGKKCTGIFDGNFDDGAYHYCNIKYDKFENELYNYNIIHEAMKMIISNQSPDIILIEDFAFSRFGKSRSVSALAEFRGLIKLAIYKNNIMPEDIIYISNTTWKSVHKNLLLPKKKDQKYIDIVNEVFNFCFETPDECDAFLMFEAARRIYNGRALTEPQLNLQKKLKERINND